MDLFFTRSGGFPDPRDPHRIVTRREAASVGLINKMPFVLTPSAEYERRFNDFFRFLAASGAASHHTWEAYARDILMCHRFLETVRRKTIWEAEAEDLEEYYLARVVHGWVDEGGCRNRLSRASWNRALTALTRLYEWGVMQGLVEASPFRYRTRRSWGTGWHSSGETAEHNSLRAKAAKRGDIRFVTMEQYRLFRRVGLQGLLPSGAPDPEFRKRTGFRDSLMGDLLVVTGMRIEEAGALLLPEVEALLNRREKSMHELVSFDLAPQTAKGDKSRKIQVPHQTLNLLSSYLDLDREVAVQRARRHTGGYRTVTRPLLVRRKNLMTYEGPINETDQQWQISGIHPLDRIRLVEVEAGVPVGPAYVFLTERGLPQSNGYWTTVFARASARCRAFGIDIEVTPHTLRHTYAMQMLSKLICEHFTEAERNDLKTPGTRAYRRLLGDPLDHLRRRLGHASITTTMKYIHHLPEAEEIADRAAASLAEDIYGEDLG